MSDADPRDEAYAKLDKAIREAVEVLFADEETESPEVLSDWVVLVGMQFFNSDGDRGGVIGVLPQGGSQPSYITVGLLQTALARQLDRETE